MSQPLSHNERIAAIGENRILAVKSLSASLAHDLGLPLEVVHPAVALAAIMLSYDHYDARGYMNADAAAKLTAGVAAKLRPAKSGTDERATDLRPVNGRASDGREFHELSRDELLLLDSRDPNSAEARERSRNPHAIHRSR